MCFMSHDTCLISLVIYHMSLSPKTIPPLTPPLCTIELFEKQNKNSFGRTHFWSKIANYDTSLISVLFSNQSFCDKLLCSQLLQMVKIMKNTLFIIKTAVTFEPVMKFVCPLHNFPPSWQESMHADQSG